MKIIITVLIENIITFKLLLKYLKKIIELKQVNEIHFWNYVKSNNDEKFIKKISNISRTSSNSNAEYTQIFTPVIDNDFCLTVTNASNDIHIKIKDKFLNIYYEIVLGGWGNTKSVIRKNDLEICSLIKNNIINNNIELNIKVSIKNNFLGIYKNDNIIFNYELDEAFSIDEIFLKTGYGSSGNFNYETIQNKGFYLMDVCDKNKKHYYCEYYKNNKFINDIIINCNDITSFIDLQKLPKFIDFIKNTDDFDLVMANTINSYNKSNNDDNDDNFHYYFIKNYKSFLDFEHKNETIEVNQNISYNFIGFKGNIFSRVLNNCDYGNTEFFFKNKNFKSVICCDFFVSYLPNKYSYNDQKIYKLIYNYKCLYNILYHDINETKNNTNIVVSRYKKNVDFVYKINNGFNINIFIYDKENSENPLNIPVNKGQEASVYLKYIIDYYDELSEFTFFMHDDEYAWHHSGSIIDKYNKAKTSSKLYFNVNDRCHWNEPNLIKKTHGDNLYNDFMTWYNEYIEEFIPVSKIPNNKDFIYGYCGSAQFLVHKILIQNLPKKFYEKIYNWIISTDLENWITSRFLEWTWHIMWVIYPKYITPFLIKNAQCKIIQQNQHSTLF
jgi:hypothetical protein